MLPMENEVMLTDTPEEKIELLENRIRILERQNLGFDAEQRLRNYIRSIERQLVISIDKIEDRLNDMIVV